MTHEALDLSWHDGFAVLVIRRPDKLNALDGDMVEALTPLLREVERSRARALIVTGEGHKAFSAGGDIAAWSRLDAETFGRRWVRDGHTAFDALARLPQPVIAVLNGHTLGGGVELAATADLRIAEAHAVIGQPETGLGVIPGWSGTQRATRRFGAQVVRRMAIFGETFTADQALVLGLVDAVVPKGAGRAAGEAAARRVAERGRQATEMTKMLINAAEGEEGGRVIEAFAGVVAVQSDELVEGLAAFREKRKPRFGGNNQK